MQNNDFWKSLERFLKSKIPNHIKNILNFCGFNNDIAFLNFCEKSIEDIELYINKNRQIFNETILQITSKNIDENISPFEFKPGEKTLLLSLSRYYSDLKKSKVKRNKRERVIKDDGQLKNNLVEKIKKYANSKSFVIQLSIKDIIEFKKTGESERGIIHCRLKCVFCKTYISCKYDSYWEASNYQKHLKLHFAKVLNHRKNPKSLGLLHNQNSVEHKTSDINSIENTVATEGNLNVINLEAEKDSELIQILDSLVDNGLDAT